MKKNSFWLLLMAIFLISITSCNNEPFEFQENSQTIKDNEFSVLGKKNKIPFTIENMQQAYLNLLKNKTASKHPKDRYYEKSNNNNTTGNYQISTTHYYVKFHPQDSVQYENIINDSILAISDVPFEYNVEDEGAKYQDPELEGTDFTYYYSVVPIDYQLPNDVPHETLANLHFTKEDLIEDDAPEIELQKVDFYHDLNLEALKTTNNLENEKQDLLYIFTNSQGAEEHLTWQQAIDRSLNLEDLIINFNQDDYPVEKRWWRRSKWTPKGTITIREDAINQNVGVMGARVRVRKWGWLVIRRAHTNRNGYFQTGRTRTKRVKYTLYFKHNPYFTVKAGTIFWNARDRDNSTHTRRSWSRHYNSGIKQFYGLIHNASYDYYSRIIYQYGISHPGFFKRIVGKNWYYTTSHSLNGLTSGFLFYDIRIVRGNGIGSYRGSDGIYSTTVHELTHQGHRNLDVGMFSVFSSGSCNRAVLIESWAEGVETILTNDRYNSLTNNYSSSFWGDNVR